MRRKRRAGDSDFARQNLIKSIGWLNVTSRRGTPTPSLRGRFARVFRLEQKPPDRRSERSERSLLGSRLAGPI
jgi:hypothetical protein